MNPKHITPKLKNNRAFAPYNFVELPDENKLVTSLELPTKNCYDKQRQTGYILCNLVTETPLYIRNGLSPDDFKKFGDLTCNHEEISRLTSEEQKRWTDFFNNPNDNLPIIPGSSLRGMLREIIEIVTYSKIDQVSGHQKLFFRAVATPKEDPLTKEYEQKLYEVNQVKAGYLKQQEDGSWRIYIAQDIEKQPFIWVKESLIPNDIGLIKLNHTNYKPQYLEVRFDEITKYKNRYIANQISKNNIQHNHSGYLVTSGNMMEGNKEGKSPRQYHCLIGEQTDNFFSIDPNAIDDYIAALTDFQKEYFDKNKGILKNDHPVFFVKNALEDKVTLFGHSPNFRVPYTPPIKNGRAASVTDFIPSRVKSSENPDIDMTEAMFGWINKKSEDKARGGRIFITDAMINDGISEEKIWCQENSDERITPPILSSPKPTTFQHYLIQTDPDGKRETLKHYGSNPNNNKGTVIRGYKLYWHHKDVSNSSIRENSEEEISKKPKQYTKIRPINPQVSFNFKIYFENLTEQELGALLWVLDLAKEKGNRVYVKNNQEYRFSLGMGKPFGMGAIRLTNQELWLSQRQEKRYQKLFNINKWETGNYKDTELEAELFVESFKNYLLERIGENTDKELENVERIKMLLTMLSFPGKPKGSVRYMQIEHPQNKNEYDQRPVLPNPFDI